MCNEVIPKRLINGGLQFGKHQSACDQSKPFSWCISNQSGEPSESAQDQEPSPVPSHLKITLMKVVRFARLFSIWWMMRVRRIKVPSLAICSIPTSQSRCIYTILVIFLIHWQKSSTTFSIFQPSELGASLRLMSAVGFSGSVGFSVLQDLLF